MLLEILQPKKRMEGGGKVVTVPAFVWRVAAAITLRRRFAESSLEPLEISRDLAGLLLSGSEQAWDGMS